MTTDAQVFEQSKPARIESYQRRERKMPNSLEGHMLGKYRILEPIGRGGMAQVYRAYHPRLDRYIAVKVLRSDLVEEVEFLARFQREAQAVANLRHANVVQVYDFDVEGDVYFMVMELLDGDTLKARLQAYRSRHKQMAIGDILRITMDCLTGLAYAHEEGIIHRDIKPANILLTKNGQAVLTDFGIAQIIGGTTYTVSGALMGTLAYMAPEQGLEGKTGFQSDIYSIGIVIYEMLTGRPPFEGDTPLAILMKHVNDPLPLPRSINPAIPEPLERVVLKSLAKLPDDRYLSVDAMIEGLQTAIEEAGLTISGRIAAPDHTTRYDSPTGVVVLSGEDREQVSDVLLLDDDTENDRASLKQTEDKKRVETATVDFDKAPVKAAGKTLFEEMRETLTSGERVISISAGELKAVKKDFWRNTWSTILLMVVVIAGYNLMASLVGLVSGNWRIYQVGWPAEILLVAMLFSLVMAKSQAPWMMIPTGLVFGNGLLLSFYALTGWWQAWSFLWPLEPLLVLGTLVFTLWLGARRERKGELTERSGQALVRITVMVFLIVIGVAALPLGKRN